MHLPVWILLVMLLGCFMGKGEEDVWKDVECDERYLPSNCDFEKIPLLTVEDYDRCGPAILPPYARNYLLGWAGRGVTYRENRIAFERIKIKPKMLRDITHNSLGITALGQNAAFPVGISPVGLQKLAHPEGENAIAAAAAAMNTIMILSCYSATSLEEVAASFKGSISHLWMQLYIFSNMSLSVDIVRRAEKSGYKAIVLTVDSSLEPPILCDAKSDPRIRDTVLGNFPSESPNTALIAITTFKHISWLRTITNLPIVAKGILRGADALIAMQAGASAIFVSNHGGRQQDSALASIDALADVVDSVKLLYPFADVYIDGGIRNGFDVYKALARGAKMVFVGRPIIWGLAIKGSEGVKDVLNILQTEFNTTMLLSGASNPGQIRRETVVPATPTFR